MGPVRRSPRDDAMARSAHEIYWSPILADFRRSGLTQVQFCERRGVSIHAFRSWLYRLRPGLPPVRSRPRANTRSHVAPNVSNPSFLPVHVRRASTSTPFEHQAHTVAGAIQLVLSNEFRLSVPTGFDPSTLHLLLDVLEQRR
jgi:hypothetical protein